MKSKSLIVKLLVAAVVGIGVPMAVAGPAQAVNYCETTIFNQARPSGSPLLPDGWVVCEYGITWRLYDSRWHAFGVGTDAAVYHVWQNSVGGAYGGWVSLGGKGFSSVKTLNYTNSSGGLALEIAVLGQNSTWYCKNYNGNITGAWWPSSTTWSLNAAACRLF